MDEVATIMTPDGRDTGLRLIRIDGEVAIVQKEDETDAETE